MRLLTLPDCFPTSERSSKFERISKYMFQKSKKTKNQKRFYGLPDPYLGHPLSNEHVEYYSNDDIDCLRQALIKTTLSL